MPLNFPPYSLKFRYHLEKQEVWDIVRKRWVVLTPEELVRQHLIHYLHEDKGYPLSLMAVEKGLKVNGQSRRTDLVIYNKELKPLLIAECKAPEVTVNGATFDQAARYNITLQVPYLLITNGMEHFCCAVDLKEEKVNYLKSIPLYREL